MIVSYHWVVRKVWPLAIIVPQSGGRGLDAQPQVAEGDDGEDDLDDVGHRVDDRLADHVGQQVAGDDPQAGRPPDWAARTYSCRLATVISPRVMRA